MSKGFKSYFPAWMILMALINVIAWVVPVDHNKTFFVAYGFTMGAMLVQLTITLIALTSKEKAIKYPAVIFSICGAVLVVLISALCVWFKAKAWIVVVVNSVVLALNWILVQSINIRYEGELRK